MVWCLLLFPTDTFIDTYASLLAAKRCIWYTEMYKAKSIWTLCLILFCFIQNHIFSQNSQRFIFSSISKSSGFFFSVKVNFLLWDLIWTWISTFILDCIHIISKHIPCSLHRHLINLISISFTKIKLFFVRLT